MAGKRQLEASPPETAEQAVADLLAQIFEGAAAINKLLAKTSKVSDLANRLEGRGGSENSFFLPRPSSAGDVRDRAVLRCSSDQGATAEEEYSSKSAGQMKGRGLGAAEHDDS